MPADLFEPLGLVQAEIKRLAQFLDEFLQFARPRELTRTSLDVARLIREVVELLRPQAASAQLLLEVEAPPLPPVPADEPKLRQALFNLALNAIQATPSGGVVRIATGQQNGDLCIYVDDSGPGVPEAVRHRIFEPFFTTKDAGTGLGLPLVHSIVQQHGGTIALETSPAGGARFVVRLPLAADRPR